MSATPVSARPRRHRTRPRVLAAVAAVLVVALAGFALSLGELRLTAPEMLGALVDPHSSPLARYFVVEVRLPRVVAALVAGVALGVAGALSQTVTGNPLGSPDILGFTTGAATGAVVVIALLGADPSLAAPAAVAGAVLSAAAVVALSRRAEDGVAMHRLVLVGVGVAAGLAGLNRVLVARAPTQRGIAAAMWEAGSVNGVLWHRILLPTIGVLVLLAVCVALVRGLEVIGFGDDTARALGTRPDVTRVGSIAMSVLLVAMATAIAGPVAFVAMAAPHASRLLARTPRPPLVLSGLVGAVVTLSADLVGRSILPRGELAMGMVTGVVGGVYLVFLLSRGRGRSTT